MALFTIAGLSMASEFDVADNDLHLYKLQNGITALVHTVDDELRVLPIDYHPGSSNGPRVIFTDDELRVLPIDYHPPRQTRPNRPIMADDDELRVLPIDYRPGSGGAHFTYADDDDELRVLPIGYHPGSGGARFTYADDDDELRVLPIDYRPGSHGGPHVIYTDDELRVLPIDYRPPRQTRPSGGVWTDDELRILPIDHLTRPIKPNRPIMADDDDDDEFRVVSSAFTNAMSKYGKKDKKDKKPVSEEIVQNDDEFRLVGVGAGSLTHKKNATETAKPVKLNAKKADDADNDLHLYKLQNGITAFVHTVDDELRVLPIDYHPPRQTRPSGGIWTDDELRILPIDHLTRPIKPNRPIMADDDELRLIAVGPGSLTHKRNTTETAKPIEVKPTPKRFITGAAKLNTTISSSAADDEMRFAHFIPQYRPQREKVETEAVDNSLVELSDLLKESQEGAGNDGFLSRRRR